MEENTDIYCPVCFAMPGEPCREKFVAHGTVGVTPVMCATHGTRRADSGRARYFKELSPQAPQEKP